MFNLEYAPRQGEVSLVLGQKVIASLDLIKTLLRFKSCIGPTNLSCANKAISFTQSPVFNI